MKKVAVWKRVDFAPYYYVVHLFVDGKYTGIGRFCDTWEEMIEFCKAHGVPVWSLMHR